MTVRGEQAIPYERQLEDGTNRMCGAAALSMVYRSLAVGRAAREAAAHGERRQAGERRVAEGRPPGGVERRQGPRRVTEGTQSDLFRRISRPGASGSPACATNLMVRDALARGFSAVALQASSPLQLLHACQANGLRVILNHRLRPDRPSGHYTVLVGMDDTGVVVHDPFAGPSQRVPYGQLLELWQPRLPGSEIAGNVLIAVADAPPQLERCPACSAPFPAEVPCPKCGGRVPMSPPAAVGCVTSKCVRRAWLRVCCPGCDYTFPYVGGPGEKVPGAPVDGRLPPDLHAHLAKFRAHLLSVPKLAARGDLQQLLAQLEQTEEKLRLAEVEEAARQQTRGVELKARVEAAQKNAQAAARAAEAAAQPPAPLDGKALVAEMMKNLGLAG